MELELLEKDNGLRIFKHPIRRYGYDYFVVEQKPTYHELLWKSKTKFTKKVVQERGTFKLPLPHVIYLMNSGGLNKAKARLNLCSIAVRRSKIQSVDSRLSLAPLPNMYGFRPCGSAYSKALDLKENPLMWAVNQVICGYWDGPATTDGTWRQPSFWKKAIREETDSHSVVKNFKAWEKMKLKEVLSFPWPLTDIRIRDWASVL